MNEAPVVRDQVRPVVADPVPALRADPGLSRFAAIDGLRGLAILWVTLYHLFTAKPDALPQALWPLFICGHLGVSLFFSISGFCLYQPIARRGTVSWSNFYLRRALRILPVYWLCLIVWSVFLQWSPAIAIERIDLAPWRNLWTHLTFLHPLWPDTISRFNGGLWSLGIEEQFYWFFPLFVLLMTRWPIPTLIGGLLLSMTWQSSVTQYYATKQLVGHLIEFFAGMYAARLVARRETRYARTCLISGAVALALLPWLHCLGRWGALAVPARAGYSWWWGDVSFAVVWFALIYGGVSVRVMGLSHAVEFAPLRGLGIISYSVYIYNSMMHVVPRLLFPGFAEGSWPWWCLGFGSAVGAGLIGYVVAEKPFLALRAKLRSCGGPHISLAPRRSARESSRAYSPTS